MSTFNLAMSGNVQLFIGNICEEFNINSWEMTIKEICFIFCRQNEVLDLKAKFRSSLKDSSCRKCMNKSNQLILGCHTSHLLQT